MYDCYKLKSAKALVKGCLWLFSDNPFSQTALHNAVVGCHCEGRRGNPLFSGLLLIARKILPWSVWWNRSFSPVSVNISPVHRSLPPGCVCLALVICKEFAAVHTTWWKLSFNCPPININQHNHVGDRSVYSQARWQLKTCYIICIKLRKTGSSSYFVT